MTRDFCSHRCHLDGRQVHHFVGRRLKMLDLRHGRITGEGARLLAECPDAKNLELLDVSRNELTAEGVSALHDAGVLVDVDHQHGSTATYAPGSHEAMQYLYEGDYE